MGWSAADHDARRPPRCTRGMVGSTAPGGEGREGLLCPPWCCGVQAGLAAAAAKSSRRARAGAGEWGMERQVCKQDRAEGPGEAGSRRGWQL